jgi:hypothetical protein
LFRSEEKSYCSETSSRKNLFDKRVLAKNTQSIGEMKVVLACIISLFVGTLHAQDIDKISKKDILKVSGGLSFQTTSYTAIGTPQKRAPFLWQLNLNLNLNILGVVSAPFSATVSSQQSKLSTPQPFNSFGISPKYKAFTAHLGYRSINLSEFTLSGSQFLGVGIEIAPKNSFIKGKALYGKFSEPVYFNPDGTLASTPSFSRFGWGAGITLGKKATNQVSFNMFRAEDDPNSLNIPQESLSITPAENLAFGVTTKQKITKQVDVEAEVGLSFYTNNTNVEEGISEGYSYINNIFLFNSNSTSEFKKAITGAVNFKPTFAKFKLKYRRVDPGYKTLGTSFINNDYEDLSLKTSFGAFQKKFAISVSGGMQRNNLEKDKVSQLLRLIASAAVNYTINKKWTTSLNVANFNSSTRQTIIVDIDSLRFVQTTKSFGWNLSRSHSNENSNNSISLSFNYQDAIVNDTKTTTFYNSNLGWQKQIAKHKLSMGVSLTGMYTISEVSTNTNFGPTANIAKTLAKDKLQLNLLAVYLSSYIDGNSSGNIINLTLGGQYSLFKKHKIGFNVSDIIKNVNTVNSSELTANVNYMYSF